MQQATFAVIEGVLFEKFEYEDRLRNGRAFKPQLGRCPVFTEAQKRELSKQIILINFVKLFFEITPAQIQQSTYIFVK